METRALQSTVADATVTDAQLQSLLARASEGDLQARNAAFELVYGDLRTAAAKVVQRHPSARHRVRPTSLVHDLIVKFSHGQGLRRLADCRSFVALAVDAMEKLLVDQFRRANTLKRGRDWRPQGLEQMLDELVDDGPFSHLDLYDALQRLAETCPHEHAVVRYRFFGGLTIQETAEALGVSASSVERCWRLARARLYRDLAD